MTTTIDNLAAAFERLTAIAMTALADSDDANRALNDETKAHAEEIERHETTCEELDTALGQLRALQVTLNCAREERDNYRRENEELARMRAVADNQSLDIMRLREEKEAALSERGAYFRTTCAQEDEIKNLRSENAKARAVVEGLEAAHLDNMSILKKAGLA